MEARLILRNGKSGNPLFVDADWACTTCDESKSGEQSARFKVQWCERSNQGVATTVMIRTDCHPQSLLDVRDLKFQGGALDGTKCDDRNRWWTIHYLELEPGAEEKDVIPVVMFQSKTESTYLAEKDGGGVECIALKDDTPIADLPDSVKWKLTVGGKAWTPGMVATVAIGTPLAVVAAAVSGGIGVARASVPIAAALTASGATTLAGLVGTTGAIVTGATIAGVAVAARGLLSEAFKQVSDSLFVPW